MSHRLLLGAAALPLLLAPVPACAADPVIEGVISRFVEAFNHGDLATAAATHATPAHIVDEVPPFSWRGTQALADWAASEGTDAKARGLADQHVTIDAPTRELITGDRAYVVVPAVYSFTQRGTKMAEQAQMTFVLARQAEGWKITDWTWTGPNPSPVR